MLGGSTLRSINSASRAVQVYNFSCCLPNRAAHSPFLASFQRLHTCTSHSNRSGSSQSSKGAMDSDGFAVENLDSESKEKLQSLKDMLLKNAYFEKYKAKIVKAQQSYPLEFLALLEGLKTSKTKPKAAECVPKMSHTKKKELDDVIKVHLLMELEKDDVSFIWQEYHRKKNLVAACMPGQAFAKIIARTEICPTFVLPLAHKSGHDFHVVQFSNNAFYLTPLVSWQAYKENSPVTLTLIFYDELKTEKGVVLMRGEYDKNSLSLEEAQNLAVQMHLYYAEPDFVRTTIMERFVSDPENFTHEDLIVELKRMEQDHAELFGNGETKDAL